MDVRKLGLSDDDLAALGYTVSTRSRPDPGAGPSPGSVERGRVDRGIRTWFWTLAFLTAVAWFAHPDHRMPPPVPANQPDSVFSSGRAMSQLVEIARAPRPVGSPEHERVRGLLVDRLSTLGLSVETQEAEVVAVDSGVVTVAPVRNLIARRAGNDPTGVVVLTAHYDGVPVSRAAADDGMGIAAILETLRAIAAGPPLRNDLLVVFTDAGELGALGVREFLAQDPWRGASPVVLSIDAAGVRGPARLTETMDANGSLIQGAARALPSPVASSTLRALDATEVGEDFHAFRDRGVPTVGLTSLGGRSAHHAAGDRPIHVSETTLQHHGSQLLALTRAFGSADLSDALAPVRGDRVYLSLPFVGIVDYSANRASLVTAALALLFVLSILLLRVRGGDPRRTLSGVLLGALVTGLSTAAGWGLLEVLRRLHPEFGRVEGLVYESASHVLALAAVALGMAVGAYGAARRRYSRRELAVGSALLPVAAVVWLTVSAPWALPAAQLALGLALVAVVPLVLLPSQHHPGRWLRVVLLALAAGVLLALVPELELVAAALTLEQAPLIGGLLGLSVLLLLPAFEWLIRPGVWWTPAVAFLVAAVTLLAATPRARGKADHPVPTSLVLLAEDTLVAGPTTVPTGADVGTRADSTSPGNASANLRWVTGHWLTVPGVGEEWARSWVVGPSDRGSDPGPLFLPGDARWVVAGAGAEANVPPPTVRVVERSGETGEAAVTLEIASAMGAEMLALRLAEGSSGVVSEVNGRRVAPAPDGAPVRTLVRWSPSPTTVRITTDDEGPLALELLEHHLRPAEVLGDNFFVREDSVIADASTGSDRLIQRVRVDVPRD